MTSHSDLIEIFQAGIAAVRPSLLFPPLLQEDSSFSSWKQSSDRYFLALGKASIDSARAILSNIDCSAYFVLSPYDDPEHSLDVHVGTHPIPDRKSYEATSSLLSWLDNLSNGSLLVILSGGTSALCVYPLPTVKIRSKFAVNDLLLRSGASIQEMNAVRKHLSAVKGGRLASHVTNLQTAVLAISDVIGDDLSVIGSGPFYPDPSTFLDAKQVLLKYSLWNTVQEDVRATLEEGCAGRLPETPKPGSVWIEHKVVASNEIARMAAATRARAAGYEIRYLSQPIQGDVHQAAELLSRQLNEMPPRTALIAGGEVTVRLQGQGKGGRNQHLALLMAEKLQGQSVQFGAMGTDGVDGNSPAAGAWVDGETLLRSGEAAFKNAVQHCDSYSYFQKIDQTIITGPTGTNVMDLYIALKL